MKLPKPISPERPYAYEFEERIERVYIYECIQSLQEEYEEDEDEEKEKADEGFIFDENTLSWFKPKAIEEVDLAWLLTQIPEGIKPSDIKIEFGYHTSSMAYEDHYIRFYYEKTIPARPDEYKALMKKYNQDLKIYEKELKDWEEACLKLEIEETELKLKKLKRNK